MMKRLVLASSLILMASLAGQVEHAPTVAQCQADQRLWMSRTEGPSSQLPEYNVIVKWTAEMGDCAKVDPDNSFKYYNTEAELTAEQQIRLAHFLDRRNLWQQFIAEDAAGKR
jgi:hypothetical protein